MRSVPRCELVVVLSVIVLSCAGGDPSVSNQARVREYLQAILVEREYDQWARYFHPEASINSSRFALRVMRGTSEGVHFSFADVSLEIAEQIAQADSVATRFVIHGIHTQPFNMQPATNEPVTLNGFVFDHFRDGKIVDSRMVLDIWGLSQQIAAQGRSSD